MSHPKVGMIVNVCTTRSQANGHSLQPGIVTQVWGPECVNVKVLPDCADPYDETSLTFLPEGPPHESQLSYHCWPA